jgi:hypothetical protein
MQTGDPNRAPFRDFVLGYQTPPHPELQAKFETLDAALRSRLGIGPEKAAAGLLDLRRVRLALIRPDWMTYGASVPKVGILLAYFQLRPEAVVGLDPDWRRELGEMIKLSSNEMAAKYSQELGLKQIQEVLCSMGFYDARHGGGIWVGKHYGVTGERIGDPVADLSHAVTVRQVLRFYLALEQGALIAPSASATMREIFESPQMPHQRNKFLKGLLSREVQCLRKSGSWEDWLHDSAVITAPDRHYILVGLTEHPRGDEYLCGLAESVDDFLKAERA